MRITACILVIVGISYLIPQRPKPAPQPEPPKVALIPDEKIDRFYRELDKLERWYTTSKRMPADAKLYRERLEELTRETVGQ